MWKTVLSPGAFVNGFVLTFFLILYLHVVLHHSSAFFENTVKVSLIGILIILVRMAVPLDFPFTYTIHLPRVLYFVHNDAGDQEMHIELYMFLIWYLVSLILFLQMAIRYLNMRQSLSLFCLSKNNPLYQRLSDLMGSEMDRKIDIAVIPKAISPAITGFRKPILILPEAGVESLSDEELRYICLHEIVHYQKHHLWLALLMEIVCTIHWWNPFVYYLKKEFLLYLELSNDSFLLNSDMQVNAIDYAELIVKTAKQIQVSHSPEPCYNFNFVVKRASAISTRISYILGKHRKEAEQGGFLSYLCKGVVVLAVLISIFVVPEADFIELEPILIVSFLSISVLYRVK